MTRETSGFGIEGLTPEQITLRDDCIATAGEIYGSILADPVRAAQIRAVMAEDDATDQAAVQTAEPPPCVGGRTGKAS